MDPILKKCGSGNHKPFASLKKKTMLTLTDHLVSLGECSARDDRSSATETRADSWISVSEAAANLGILQRNEPIGIDVVAACQRAMDIGRKLPSDGPLREHALWAFGDAIPTVRDCARARAGESDGWPLARECTAWLIRLCDEGPLNLHGFGERLKTEFHSTYTAARRTKRPARSCVSCARPPSRNGGAR